MKKIITTTINTNQELVSILKALKQVYELTPEAEMYTIYFVNQDLDPQILLDENQIIVNDLPAEAFIVMDHDGQYNQTQDMLIKRFKRLTQQEVQIKVAKAYRFYDVSPQELDLIKSYLINSVVAKEVKLDEVNFDIEWSDNSDYRILEGFRETDESQLMSYCSLDLDDLKFIQECFKQEGRDPRFCELKLLEAYWSDHCRHTTFLTQVNDVEITEGEYQAEIFQAYQSYLETHHQYASHKPISLMDLATINARELKQRQILNNVEETDEVNACSVEIDIDVNGETQRWLHMFKNETHNHPTEIEPYGGAHTCIGGAIRDPLSGRAFVMSGMRLIGAGNPYEKGIDTLEKKLPQYYLAQMAKKGFSDYANQIGASVGLVREYYHDGFKAKRMECGALVGAVKKEYVTRQAPVSGDLVYLLGAPTGRDGLGAAVGSSSIQTEKSLTKAAAEVQKGNPFEERKIIRLFNKPDASKLIKKSNDFGAGGVSVAIGELADGLDIDLNQVSTKYPGMNGYEIALSESQERMAVVIDPQNQARFEELCQQEDVSYSIVATVTDSKRLVMRFNQEVIIDLPRSLLDSAGAPKYSKVIIDASKQAVSESYKDLNQTITPSLSQGFDATINRNRVFVEYGGKTQQTKQRGMVSKFPVEQTQAVSVMTYGFAMDASAQSAFLGGYRSVLAAINAHLALTGRLDNIRLSMQEFFPSIQNNPIRFGTVFQSLLGAYQVMKELEIGAIGGKDSMSGTFKDIDVVPTLLCFAVSDSTIPQVVSREFKQLKSNIYITKIQKRGDFIDFNSYRQVMTEFMNLHQNHQILAASDVSEYGLNWTLKEMAAGNEFGYTNQLDADDQFGQIVFEVNENCELSNHFELVGQVTNQKVELTQELKPIYPGVDFKPSSIQLPLLNYEAPTLKNNKALIIVLEGCTGELDCHAALSTEGFDVKEFVIKTHDYQQSIIDISQELDKASLLVIPDGHYFSIPMSTFLNDIQASITHYLQAEKVILGLGAGFEALIKAGYLSQEIKFNENPGAEYVHHFIDCQTADNQEYTSILSGYKHVITVDNLKKLTDEVKVLAQKQSVIEKDECPIEAVCSLDNKVLGICSHIERMSPDLYQNIQIKGMPPYLSWLKQKEN